MNKLWQHYCEALCYWDWSSINVAVIVGMGIGQTMHSRQILLSRQITQGPKVLFTRFFSVSNATHRMCNYSMPFLLHEPKYIWGILYQKQTGTGNYISWYLWDVITCPCTWYMLLSQLLWHNSYRGDTVFTICVCGFVCLCVARRLN